MFSNLRHFSVSIFTIGLTRAGLQSTSFACKQFSMTGLLPCLFLCFVFFFLIFEVLPLSVVKYISAYFLDIYISVASKLKEQTFLALLPLLLIFFGNGFIYIMYCFSNVDVWNFYQRPYYVC